jgi:hypothetical protein
MSAAKGGAGAPFGAACAPWSLRRWANGTARSTGGRRRRRSPSSTPSPWEGAPTAAARASPGKAGGKTGRPSSVARRAKGVSGPSSGTLFGSRKIPVSEWVEFAIHLMEYHSVRTSSSDNRNAETTGEYRISKVFEALRGCQVGHLVLSGEVFFDETYVSVAESERAAKKGIQLRGPSRKRICIACGTDKARCFAVAEGVGKPSNLGVWRAYSPHIAEGSVGIHDGDRSHAEVADALHLKNVVHEAEGTKGLPDKDSPMEPITRSADSSKDSCGPARTSKGGGSRTGSISSASSGTSREAPKTRRKASSSGWFPAAKSSDSGKKKRSHPTGGRFQSHVCNLDFTANNAIRFVIS